MDNYVKFFPAKKVSLSFNEEKKFISLVKCLEFYQKSPNFDQNLDNFDDI